MGQLGFFDVRQRYESLDAKKRSIDFHRDDVPWESFRSNLMAALIKGSRHAARCLWLPRLRSARVGVRYGLNFAFYPLPRGRRFDTRGAGVGVNVIDDPPSNP